MKTALVVAGRNIKNAVVHKMRMLFLTIALSFLLLIFSFSPFHIWPLMWVALIPFLYGLSLCITYRASFLFSWLMGFLFFGATIWWIGYVTILGTILLCLYLGLFWGIWGWVFFHTRFWQKSRRLVFLSALWVVLEWLRWQSSSFEVMFLGHSQALNLWLIQISDIVGVSGISFLIIATNYFLFLILKEHFQNHSTFWDILRRFKIAIAIFSFIFLCVLSYGLIRIQAHPQRDHIRVGVVQPNIALTDSWTESLKPDIVRRHLRLSEPLFEDSLDLLVWPETAFPHFYWEYPHLMQEVKDFVVSHQTPLLLGAVTRQQDQYFNSAILLNGSTGQEQAHYDKRQLVLFGEYIPFRKQLPFLEYLVPIDDFTAGKNQSLLTLNEKWPFSVLICFEDLSSLLAAQDVHQGALFFVNMTNDAWFQKSPAAELHLHHAIFRAVENRRALLRATNTGVSGLITPEGQIQETISNSQGEKIMVAGQKVMTVPIETTMTFFTKFPWAFTFLSFLVILLAYEKQKNFR